jgi:hypothetical protein
VAKFLAYLMTGPIRGMYLTPDVFFLPPGQKNIGLEEGYLSFHVA